MKNWDFAKLEYAKPKSKLGKKIPFLERNIFSFIKDILDKDNFGDYFLIFPPVVLN